MGWEEERQRSGQKPVSMKARARARDATTQCAQLRTLCHRLCRPNKGEGEALVIMMYPYHQIHNGKEFLSDAFPRIMGATSCLKFADSEYFYDAAITHPAVRQVSLERSAFIIA